MPRVIYFASSYKVGLTALLAEQACALKESAESEFLFVSGEREQFAGLFAKLQRHQVEYLAIDGLDDHEGFFRLVKAFNIEAYRFSPGTVHVQTNWQLAIAAAARLLFGHKYAIVGTIHGYRHNLRIRSLLARLAIGLALKLWADWVLVPSSFLQNKFAMVSKKTSLLFLGVEDRYFERGGVVSWEGPARIVYPAEFRQGKNHEELIRAIARVMERSSQGVVELHLPGTGVLLERCQALCQGLGIGHAVFFPGLLGREELLELYLKCQFVVVPAPVETFGLAIAEGLVLGRVVVSRPVGVAPDVIRNGETGCLFQSHDELESLLLSLVNDRARCEEISRSALKAREVFRWRSINEQYERILNSLDRAA